MLIIWAMEKINQIMSTEGETKIKMGVAGIKRLELTRLRLLQLQVTKQNLKEPLPNTLVTVLEAVQSNLASLNEALDSHCPSREKLNPTLCFCKQSHFSS